MSSTHAAAVASLAPCGTRNRAFPLPDSNNPWQKTVCRLTFYVIAKLQQCAAHCMNRAIVRTWWASEDVVIACLDKFSPGDVSFFCLSLLLTASFLFTFE